MRQCIVDDDRDPPEVGVVSGGRVGRRSLLQKS